MSSIFTPLQASSGLSNIFKHLQASSGLSSIFRHLQASSGLSSIFRHLQAPSGLTNIFRNLLAFSGLSSMFRLSRHFQVCQFPIDKDCSKSESKLASKSIFKFEADSINASTRAQSLASTGQHRTLNPCLAAQLKTHIQNTHKDTQTGGHNST